MSGVLTRQKRKTGTGVLVNNKKSTNKVRKTSKGNDNHIQESTESSDDESDHSETIHVQKKHCMKKSKSWKARSINQSLPLLFI